MNELTDILSKALFSVLGVLLTACAAKLAQALEGRWKEKQKTEAIAGIVEACVRAVEQMNASFSGEEKRRDATEMIHTLLEEKGFCLSDTELRILLESAVATQKEQKGSVTQ